MQEAGAGRPDTNYCTCSRQAGKQIWMQSGADDGMGFTLHPRHWFEKTYFSRYTVPSYRTIHVFRQHFICTNLNSFLKSFTAQGLTSYEHTYLIRRSLDREAEMRGIEKFKIPFDSCTRLEMRSSSWKLTQSWVSCVAPPWHVSKFYWIKKFFQIFLSKLFKL